MHEEKGWWLSVVDENKLIVVPSGSERRGYGGARKLNTEVSSAASAHATGFPGSPAQP